MAGSSSHVLMSPTLRRENGESNLSRAMPLASPGGSEVGSVASAGLNRAGASKSSDLPNRLGNLHGAGLSSLQLALGEASGSLGSTSGSSGFNAISTLLNDPKRAQRPIDPNSSRYPPISQSHTDLVKVKRSDYEGYIAATQKEWERFQRNVKLGSRGKARLEAEEAEAEAKRQSIDTIQASLRSEVDHTAVIGKKKLPPLSTVPQVFFTEDFDLGNPYTFDLVTERYKAAGAASSSARNGSANPTNGYDVALNQMLQEKLSYYSDVVEQHLILEISARSTSFFAALGNLQDLESEAAHCLKRVESLKAELEDKEENIAKAGLRVIREQAKRREMVERLEAVGILQLLCEKKDLCRLLIQNGEWNEALGVIEMLRNVVLGKEKLQTTYQADSSLPPHVDLEFTSIASVKAFLPQLEEMKDAISTQLETELMAILRQNLEEQIGDATNVEQSLHLEIASVTPRNEVTSPTLNGPISAGSDDLFTSPATAQETVLQGQILPHLLGLVRTQGVDRALNTYREVALKATRMTLWKFLCNSKEVESNDRREDLATLLEDDEAASGRSDAKLGPGGAEAASKLREMTHSDFLNMTRFVLIGLTRIIQAVDVQTRVILRILAEEGRREESNGTVTSIMMPKGVSTSLPTVLSSIVSDVGGLTHTLSSRLLSLRSSTHIGLPLSEFLAVFHLCWSFILQSEALCNRMIIGLRGVVLNQAKSWLANFHKIRIERAARAVEEENWNQAETTQEQQKCIQLIVDSATIDPPLLVLNAAVSELPNGASEGDEKQNSGEQTMTKTLEIEDRQYFVVGATLDVLELLLEYLKVIINLPLLSTETMGRVVEFSKQFNSRTCQVVLGAGAMRSAGLKNITAKHLALASQSLSVMITLIPYIRETVRRHLSPNQAVMLIEFDKLKRDYQEHQYEIHSKLVAIMSDRLTVHCRAMNNVQWNVDGDSTDPIKPAVDLAKETTTLHKVLSKFLQPSVVENVIGQVLTAIDKRVSFELSKVDVKEDVALKKMNIVKDFFQEKFSTLKNVKWSATEFEAVIEEQKVALEKFKVASLPPPPPPPPPEKKQVAVPAYKPRINIFGRKNQPVPGTPPTARASTEVRTSTDGAVPTPVDGVATVDLAVPEAEAVVETKTEPATPVDEVEEHPSVPAKDKVEEKVKEDTLEEQAPSTPSKEASKPSLQLEDPSSPAPPSPSFSSRPPTPGTPATPATPDKVMPDTAVVPTPGRMTLQQRLAEAARKRAQGGSNRGLQLSTGPIGSGAATPTVTESIESPIRTAEITMAIASEEIEAQESISSTEKKEVAKVEPQVEREQARTDTEAFVEVIESKEKEKGAEIDQDAIAEEVKSISGGNTNAMVQSNEGIVEVPERKLEETADETVEVVTGEGEHAEGKRQIVDTSKGKRTEVQSLVEATQGVENEMEVESGGAPEKEVEDIEDVPEKVEELAENQTEIKEVTNESAEKMEALGKEEKEAEEQPSSPRVESAV